MLDINSILRMILSLDWVEGSRRHWGHVSTLKFDTAARAKGMSEVAREAGVTRASLYKSLSDGGNPNFTTVSKVAKALGCKLSVA